MLALEKTCTNPCKKVFRSESCSIDSLISKKELLHDEIMSYKTILDEQVAEALNSTGIYSMVRHPLYLGNITTYMGWVVFTGIDWLIPAMLVGFLFYYRFIIYAEEQFLTRKFGQDYLDWKSATPLLLPAFWKFKANPQPFSFKTVLENEYSGIAASMTTAWVLLAFQWYVLGQFQAKSLFVLAMALFIVVFTLGLRYLKKKTQFFKV